MAELVDALPIAIVLVSEEGLVDYMNQRAADLLASVGLGEEFVRRMALAAVTEPRPRLTVESPQGDRSYGFQVTTLPNRSRLIAFQDITAFERTQAERDRLLQMASISEVMPAVLHELKNPLASITLMTELLLEDAGDETRDRLHAMLGELRRLSLTLDGLGRFRHEVRSTRHWAIDHSLREAFALLEPQAASRGIVSVIDVPDMPLLPFDPAAVRAALFNLFTNSMQACMSGQRIVVSAAYDRPTATLTLTVSDTGPGMPPDVRARCTELFFTTKAKGSGIGLALCAGVAEAVDGTMTIDSTPGAGTRISLTFPINPRRT